jgi:hypothetical protein
MATYYCKSAAITIADKSCICRAWISEVATNFIFVCDEVLKLKENMFRFFFKRGALVATQNANHVVARDDNRHCACKILELSRQLGHDSAWS